MAGFCRAGLTRGDRGFGGGRGRRKSGVRRWGLAPEARRLGVSGAHRPWFGRRRLAFDRLWLGLRLDGLGLGRRRRGTASRRQGDHFW